jgi:hypothetical protein
MKTPYSRSYFPPAPILTVRLAVPEEPPRLGPHQGWLTRAQTGRLFQRRFSRSWGCRGSTPRMRGRIWAPTGIAFGFTK